MIAGLKLSAAARSKPGKQAKPRKMPMKVLEKQLTFDRDRASVIEAPR
jgi:hypothetical protein